MEGQVYLCSWKKEKNGYSIWLKDKSDVRVSSSTFQKARDLMFEKLLWVYDDGEAVLNFDKAEPKSAFPIEYSQPEIYSIAGNVGVSCDRYIPNLYSEGYCKHCKREMGERTEQPFSVNKLPSTSNGAVPNDYNSIYSEDFLSLFSSDELKNIAFREVVSREKSKRKFFELIGPAITEEVAAKRFPGIEVTLCPECGKIGYYHLHNGKLYFFISRSMLPQKIPNLFVMGSYQSLRLCITGKRWREIQTKKGAKGIVADRIGVIANDDDVVPREKILESFKEKVQIIEQIKW